jgi:cytochrome b pre-mRNA-processing protein 3
MPAWPFSASATERDSGLLLKQVTRASRDPVFFGPRRVPDTFEGRFEILALHGVLALIRMRPEEEAKVVAQGFADRFFRDLDSGLREDGVGDVAVSKRIHALASAFYGRLDVYAAALASGPDGMLQEAVSRNVLGDARAPFGAALSGYTRQVAKAQAAAPWEHLLRREGWPPFAA